MLTPGEYLSIYIPPLGLLYFNKEKLATLREPWQLKVPFKTGLVKEPRMTVREVFESAIPEIRVGDIVRNSAGVRLLVAQLVLETQLVTLNLASGQTWHRAPRGSCTGVPYTLTPQDCSALCLAGFWPENRPIVEKPRRKIGLWTRLRHRTIPGDFMIVANGEGGAVLINRDDGTWLYGLPKQDSSILTLTKEQCEKFRIMDMTIVD